eukprot:13316246-Ditylum_brightwellii.AAC.1
MNLTNVKAKRSQYLGFFVFSHGTYSNRKAAHKELMLHLNMTGFDLHCHNCKHNYKRDTQAVAFASDPEKSWATKGKLYCLNNTPKAKQAMFPTTGHWKFVPFTSEGQITYPYIANMFQ